MSLINSLELKFSRLAIPHLIRVIVVFQVLNWLLIRYAPEFAENLVFDPDLIKAGQYWRFASYILLPGSTSILWILFAIPWGWMIGDGLEEAWGSFRVNLYILASMTCVAIGGLLFGYATTGGFLWSTLLMAFAIYFPNVEVLLMLVIPMKIKWLGWMTAAMIAFRFLGNPESRLEILFSMLTFVATFAPSLLGMAKHQARVAGRRQRYVASQRGTDESLHRCARCGKTEKENPQLDFRVNAQGDDICSECRAAAAPSTP